MATKDAMTQAQTLYVAYYGRPADAEGREFWANKIDQDGVDAVVDDFGASDEFNERFSELSSEELVQNLYQQVFGRAADDEGVTFYTERLDDDRLTLTEIASTIAGGAQNDDVIARDNKVAAANRYTEAAGEDHSGTAADNYAADFLSNVDAETDVDALDIDAVVADIPADTGTPSDLTEALTSLATAETNVTAALTAAAETVNEAKGDNALEGDALDTYVEQFDADQLEAAITDAEGDIADEEANVNTAEATLLNSRADTFASATGDFSDASSLTSAVSVSGVDANGSAVSATFDLGINGGDRLTDANIAKALQEAQKAVNSDKTQYTVSGAGSAASASVASSTEVGNSTETFTAKALQIKAGNAESALNADESANGTSQELLTSLRSALADLVDEGVTLSGEDVSGLSANTDVTGGSALSNLQSAVNSALTAFDNDAASAEADASDLLASFYDMADGKAAVSGDLNTGNTAADKAFNDILDSFADRGELINESNNADTFFASTETGGLLAAADALQDARDTQIENVADAEEAKADADDALAALNEAQDTYDEATDVQEDALKYFEDNDLQEPVTLDNSETATADNDLYLFVNEEVTIGEFGAEGEDKLYFGEDYANVSPVELGDDGIKGDNGDANALDIFWEEEGNNLNLYVEEKATAGNGSTDADMVEVTLAGVSSDDVDTAGGFLTADIA